MSRIDLAAIARQAAIDEGFVVEVDGAVSSELQSLQEKQSHVWEESRGKGGRLSSAAAESLQEKESHGKEGWLAPAAYPATTLDPSVQDLRELLWSSIDDAKTRDLDQVEYAEELSGGDMRVLIGIADVDAFVAKGSAIDKRAGLNATSVYTGVKTFPMLPEELSTGLTSLMQDQDRLAVVTEMTVGPDGASKGSNVYRAIVRNHAKLSYTAVGDWLDGKAKVPEAVKTKPGLEDQIRLQHEIASRLGELRKQQGAIELGTIQTTPRADERGKVVELVIIEPNAARELISNFMIAANVAMAQFMETQGGPSLRRVVRTPEHWDRIVQIAAELGEELPEKPDSRALADFLERRRRVDPDRFPDLSLAVVKSLGPGEYALQLPGEEGEGHFGLAVTDYTHSTAPNRRYADLVTQRLVKAALKDELALSTGEKSRPVPYTAETLKWVPYTAEELKQIAEHCTEREDAARKVERKIRKVAAALLLRDQIGREFEAIVTGVSPKGVFARTCKPPVDGRVVKGEEELGVGDKIRVRLKAVDPKRGFIDFVRFARGW
ncbi:MAG TPA: RNB domain-containing ribonuclease [Pyrinomonadaceae bacterium]|nr:RNB domain-containing ribonuclease [Pyrinomonadaceae bacterium]